MTLELLIFGVDGFEPRFVEHFREAGAMPELDALLDAGASIGPIESRTGDQLVPHTGPAWTSIYTGVTEDEHGVTAGGWELGQVDYAAHADGSLFAELAFETRVGVLGMPVTYPAAIPDRESWMVSGWPYAPERERVIAPTRYKYLIDDHYLSFPDVLGRDSNETATAVDNWVEKEHYNTVALSPELLDAQPIDVLAYGTQICDAMCHRNDSAVDLRGSDEVRRAYRGVDHLLGWFRDHYSPERICIVADHGFEPDGSEHALHGCSVAYNIDRPESILDVAPIVREEFDADERPVQPLSGTIDADEQAAIRDQLAAMGYLDKD